MHTRNLSQPSFAGTAELPIGLREEAHRMSDEEFTQSLAHAGTIRLHAWSATPADGDRLDCRATIAVDDRDHSVAARATGQLGALTSMLYDIGAGVEIRQFHQRHDGGGFTTILLCGNDIGEKWAIGTGMSGDEANRNALIAGANLLPH
ncbi:hypothetical protein [Gordonia sp. X0973]|uniref:hypothetical protein n=1 Tax=Gordonia sp. X0973 TaxID=2742602 RepID=UPI0026573DC2|nr:hypothetical protein [Gordonia sp. X0973]